MIMHGLFGFGSNFQSVGRKLSTRRDVLLADLRNHGSSPWHDDASLTAMTDDVEALLEGLGTSPVALCGHSLGGKVAMLTALRRPDLVSRLCVVDIAPVRYDMAGNRSIIELILQLPEAALGSRADADAALAAAAPAAPAPGSALGNPFVRQFLLQNLQPEQRTWRLNLRALLDDYDELRSFPAAAGTAAADMPALFIGGDKEGAMLGPEHLADIRAFFPAARLEMVPTGHFVHSENPGAFFSLVDGFCVGTA